MLERSHGTEVVISNTMSKRKVFINVLKYEEEYIQNPYCNKYPAQNIQVCIKKLTVYNNMLKSAASIYTKYLYRYIYIYIYMDLFHFLEAAEK